VAHYIFNLAPGDAPPAAELLRARLLSVGAGEPHRDALASGDLILVYVAAPERKFIARAELASSVQGVPGGVSLAYIEEWDPPAPMSAVLSRIDRAAGGRADFGAGVGRIPADEYEAALAVAAERATSPG